MSTIEDKILNGPQINYCDADNDDIRVNDPGADDEDCIASERNTVSNLFMKPDEESERLNRMSQIKWRTGSTNTGPKGVLEDFKKQCSTESSNDIDNLEAEFQELLNDDSILKEYMSKRISEAMKSETPIFGQVYHLQSGNQLLDAIDKENLNVLVIVHIYTKYSRPCANLNRCLNELASDLKHIKFVTLDASVTGLSGNFKDNGVPALLAYKSGNLVKSIVQLDELLDKNFDSSQVRELLQDNDLIA